jgi:hypothetical protein
MGPVCVCVALAVVVDELVWASHASKRLTRKQSCTEKNKQAAVRSCGRSLGLSVCLLARLPTVACATHVCTDALHDLLQPDPPSQCQRLDNRFGNVAVLLTRVAQHARDSQPHQHSPHDHVICVGSTIGCSCAMAHDKDAQKCRRVVDVSVKGGAAARIYV